MGKNLPIKFVMFGAMAVPVLPILPVAAAPPAASDQAGGLRVNVAFDTTILDSTVAARLEPEIAKQLGPVLAGLDLHMVTPPEVGEQNLSIRVTAFDEEQRNYEVELQLGREGEAAIVHTVSCDACNERRLIQKLVEEIPRLVESHEESTKKAGTAIEPKAATVEPVIVLEPKRENGPKNMDSPDTQVRMSALGGVGIGIAVLGVGALVAGGVEFSRGKVYDDVTQTPTERTGIDHRPPGLALLGAGAVVLVGGVTMLALDSIRMKKHRAGRSTGRVFPLWDTHSVGLGCSLRF